MKELLTNTVVIGASWCNSCKAIKELLETQGTEFSYVDVDTKEGAVFAEQEAVRGVPVVYYNGQLIARTVPQMRNWLLMHKAEGLPEVEVAPMAVRQKIKGFRPEDAFVDELLNDDMRAMQQELRLRAAELDQLGREF